METSTTRNFSHNAISSEQSECAIRRTFHSVPPRLSAHAPRTVIRHATGIACAVSCLAHTDSHLHSVMDVHTQHTRLLGTDALEGAGGAARAAG